MNIETNIDLLPYNTFHFSCIADHFVIINRIEDRQLLVKTDIFAKNKRLILWGGSNILLTQDRFPGLIIKNEIMGKEIIAEDNESVTIKVWAGENWNDFVVRTIQQGYYGIENLVSIPGTVGAAPMQNIWAYGVEAGDYILQVEYGDLNWQTHTLNKNDCQFWYRESIFKQALKDQTCITHVVFQLQKYDEKKYIPTMKYGAIEEKVYQLLNNWQPTTDNWQPITPSLIAQAVADIRASKLPDRTQIGTAGSFFKNPIIPESQYNSLKEQFPDLVGHSTPSWISNLEFYIKLSAGQLIDLSWLKGLDRGSVGTYHHHALVLIHNGWWTGADILRLCEHIQYVVYETFGVRIEAEVNII